jgi:hypothetical protein
LIGERDAEKKKNEKAKNELEGVRKELKLVKGT